MLRAAGLEGWGEAMRQPPAAPSGKSRSILRRAFISAWFPFCNGCAPNSASSRETRSGDTQLEGFRRDEPLPAPPRPLPSPVLLVPEVLSCWASSAVPSDFLVALAQGSGPG